MNFCGVLIRPALMAALVATAASLGAAASTNSGDDVLLRHSFLDVSLAKHAGSASSLGLGLRSDYEMRADPAKIDVEIRRVDGHVRPWQRLRTSSTSSVASDGTPMLFSPMPSDLGATYEVEVDRAGALAWGGPAPAPSDIAASDEQSGLICGSCPSFTPNKLTLLVTVPSEAVATPDLPLRSLQRAFEGRIATIGSGSPELYVPSESPHQPDSYQSQPLSRRFPIGKISREDFAVTSVGPLGVPGAAAIPAGTQRYVPHAVVAEVLAGKTGETYVVGYFKFASPAEMRIYLRPGASYGTKPGVALPAPQ